MTVQQLIDLLTKIEDKALPVFYCDAEEGHVVVSDVDEAEELTEYLYSPSEGPRFEKKPGVRIC